VPEHDREDKTVSSRADTYTPDESTGNGRSLLAVAALVGAVLALLLAIAAFILALNAAGRARPLAARITALGSRLEESAAEQADTVAKLNSLGKKLRREIRAIRYDDDSADRRVMDDPLPLTPRAPARPVVARDALLKPSEIKTVLDALRNLGTPSISGTHLELRFSSLPQEITSSADDDSLRKLIPRINLAFPDADSPILRRQNFIQILETRAPDDASSPYVISINREAIAPGLVAIDTTAEN